MPQSFADRRQGWQPKPRPEWVANLNAEGEILDMVGIVPLDEESLLRDAQRNTGLSDFGEDGWREHFRVLLKAINEEAKLNFMGRILTRSDLLQYLEIRLQIQDYYTRFPEIDNEVIEAPVMLLGHGRTGTTIMLEVLSADPQFRVVKRWEAMFPCPPPKKATYTSDPRIDKAERLITIFDRISPEWSAMHKYGGSLPVECAEYLYACFLSNVFTFSYQIPSYARYLATQDPRYTIRWHKKVLKLLQWKYKEKHWLLKNPIWIDLIPEVLEEYPDAKILLTHRDPIVVSDSFVTVMGTIYWWRTDDPWSGGMLDELLVPDQRARTQNNLIRWIEDGTLKPGQYANALYSDFVKNPLGTVQKIYRDLGLTLSQEAEAKMAAYLEQRPKSKYGKYEYKRADRRAIEDERAVYKRYQDYFGVPSEV